MTGIEAGDGCGQLFIVLTTNTKHPSPNTPKSSDLFPTFSDLG